MINWIRVGKKIQSLRKQAKETQKSLGAKLGIAGRMICHYEGGNSPPLENLAALASFFGKTVDWMIEDVENAETSEKNINNNTFAVHEHQSNYLSPETARLAEQINSLSAEQKEAVKTIIRSMQKAKTEKRKDTSLGELIDELYATRENIRSEQAGLDVDEDVWKKKFMDIKTAIEKKTGLPYNVSIKEFRKKLKVFK